MNACYPDGSGYLCIKADNVLTYLCIDLVYLMCMHRSVLAALALGLMWPHSLNDYTYI